MLNSLQGKVVQTIESDRNDIEWTIDPSVNELMNADSKRINRGPFRLKLGAITLFPFFKHVFSFQLFLLDDLQRLVCGHEVPVTVKLYYENDNAQLTDTGLFSLERGPILIDKTGMATVNIKFTTLSMNHANKKFVLQFSSAYDRTRQRIKTTNEIDLDYLSTITAVSTPGLQVVRNRLLVQTSVLGSDGEDKHDIWYKDEGGRENCIEMLVSLQDCDGRLVLNRTVPLVVILIYDNGEVVAKQDFLHIQSDSVLCIQNTGKTTLKLRINDVSKNHQRQLFKILVSPDTSSSPLLLDISSDQSSSIEVKSKRTTKRKVSPDASSAAHHNHHHHSTSAGAVYAALGGVGLGGGGRSSNPASSSSSSTGLLYAEGMKQEYRDALETAKQLSGYSSVYGAAGTTGGGSSVQYLPTPRSASAMDTLLNSSNHHLKEDPSADIGAALTDNLIVSDKAVSSLVDWTSSVLTTLQSIKWKPIGFEQRPSDGFIDHSKPLHSITNPNLAIDQLLSEYALSDIGSTLTTLLMRVNEINGKDNSGAGGGGNGSRKKQKLGSSSNNSSGGNMSAKVHGNGNSFSGNEGYQSNVSPRLMVEEAAVGCYTTEASNGGGGAGGGNADISRNQPPPLPPTGGEASVYYILACNQRTASSTAAEDCGFPAFDSDMQLVGYYQEKRNQLNNSTVVSFTPYSNNFTEKDKDNAEALLLSHIQTSSAAVYSLSRCNNNLQLMKHDCLVHFWLSEVNLDEEAAGGLSAAAVALANAAVAAAGVSSVATGGGLGGRASGEERN